MKNRTPFFLTKLLKRSPQNPEIDEQKGWEITADDDTSFSGWGSSPGSTSSEPIANGWADEPRDDNYNGWGSNSTSRALHTPPTPETSTNGWAYEKPNNEYNEWVSSPDGKSEPISNQSRLVNSESFPCPPIPSAPPLPDNGFNEHQAAKYQSKNGDALCVVCWEARVEGACVPCGHMASCMACLREIESKQGTCPVCRAKIDKVLRIYAISTE